MNQSNVRTGKKDGANAVEFKATGRTGRDHSHRERQKQLRNRGALEVLTSWCEDPKETAAAVTPPADLEVERRNCVSVDDHCATSLGIAGASGNTVACLASRPTAQSKVISSALHSTTATF
jgi:hypothetical protein